MAGGTSHGNDRPSALFPVGRVAPELARVSIDRASLAALPKAGHPKRAPFVVCTVCGDVGNGHKIDPATARCHAVKACRKRARGG